MNPVKIITMKNSLLLLFFLMIQLPVHPQEAQTETRTPRFHVGLDYTFMQTDMELASMTLQHSLNETLYDPIELDGEEIDDMNHRVEFTRDIQSVSISLGMIILEKPGGRWFIDGALTAGMVRPRYQAYNKETDTLEMEITSGFSLIAAGLNFNIRYSITPHWVVGVQPFLRASFGTDDKINDNIYGHVAYFDEERQNKYAYVYSRMNLYACYIWGNFTFMAGPGFYYLYNSNRYELTRTDPASSDTYKTEVESQLVSTAFIDGTLGVEWRINDQLMLNAQGAFGNDFLAHGGIRFLF
jgi:hypothetical protein